MAVECGSLTINCLSKFDLHISDQFTTNTKNVYVMKIEEAHLCRRWLCPNRNHALLTIGCNFLMGRLFITLGYWHWFQYVYLWSVVMVGTLCQNGCGSLSINCLSKFDSPHLRPVYNKYKKCLCHET